MTSWDGTVNVPANAPLSTTAAFGPETVQSFAMPLMLTFDGPSGLGKSLSGGLKVAEPCTVVQVIVSCETSTLAGPNPCAALAKSPAETNAVAPTATNIRVNMIEASVPGGLVGPPPPLPPSQQMVADETVAHNAEVGAPVTWVTCCWPLARQAVGT